MIKKTGKKIRGKSDAETDTTQLHNIRRTSDRDIPDSPKVKKANPVTAKKTGKK